MAFSGNTVTGGLLAISLAAIAVTGTSGKVYAQDNSALTLEEIIVTARKRAENIQEIPVAVTAITSTQIDDLDIQGLAEISKLTAGLVFDDEFGRGSDRPVIRGQANILGDSGVSYFIDGVYINGSIADYDLNDIERIEVVKGPQSALYGRNTYSGAINIVTKSPGDAFSSDVRFSVTDDGEEEISASVRGPIVADTLAGGLTIRRFELDGPWTNEFDGSDIGFQESESVSGVLQYTPTDRLDVRLRAYYNERDDGQPALFHQSASENNCLEDNGNLYAGLGRYFCGRVRPGEINTDYTVSAPDTREEVQSLQTSLSIGYEINDAWSLTSITGYNDRDDVQVTDGDYQPTSFQIANFTPELRMPPFPAPGGRAFFGSTVDFTFANWTQYDDFSQELRFEYEGDRVSGLFGAYYLDASTNSRDIREIPPNAAAIRGANLGAELGRMAPVCAEIPGCFFVIPLVGDIVVPRDRNDSELENVAVYGLVDFDLSDTLSVTLEGRYQEEEISRVAIVQNLGEEADPPVISSETFDSFSPRATLQWTISDSSMAYGVVGTGTKPGGFNGTVAIEEGVLSFDEEDIVSFEVGSKNVFADGQLVANFAAFFNQIEGYQLTQNVRSEDNTNTVSATVNAGDADVFGFEAELTARPEAVEGLTITLNYAYTDAEFIEGRDENQGVLNDAADNGLIDCSIGDEFPDDPNDPTGSCNASLFGSIEGNRIPRTAEHQLFTDIDLRRPLGAGDWEWFIGANLSYESSKFAQVHNLAETGDATIVNARLGFSNDRVAVNLWGKNLTDEDSTPLVLRYADGADSFKRSFVGTLRRETHYGVTVSVNFGD